jgi:acetylglutamate kinase
LKILIKIGGTLLEEPASRQAIATQLADVSAACELVVVHGGGKQVTRFLEQQGIQSRFVNGLRVSDEATVTAVVNVIAGGVNKRLVSALIAAGRKAVGLSGVDGLLTEAEQLDPALGFVGRPFHSDGRLLDLLTQGGYTPVVACIAGDKQGQIYNVNADQMAVSCAAGWGADRLFFLTDVPGVKDATGSVVQSLHPVSANELIASGVAQGGMQAKLEASLAGLNAGIKEVVISAGHEPDICRRLFAGERPGTSIIPSEVPTW